MKPTTSVERINSNSDLYFESTSICEEDCRFLLRALEKQAFEHVICAFRAQGPLTQYKELLLDHIKSALFISDEEFTLQARIVANNPYLIRIANELNPSYDNFSEWIAAGFDLTGVDLARAKKLSLNKKNSTGKLADQILGAIHKHNRNLPDENATLQELYRLPKRPFVPERLRRFLQHTENDTNGRIDIVKKEIIREGQRKPSKNGVGRPRKHQKRCQTIENGQKESSSLLFAPKQATLSNKKISNNKTAEEQAVLAILAKSSAQILKESRHKQQELQKQNEQLPSTSTAAMESLAEVALSQITKTKPLKVNRNDTGTDTNLTNENFIIASPTATLTLPMCANQQQLQQHGIEPKSHDSIDNTVEMVMSGLCDQSNMTYKLKKKRTSKQLNNDATCICARVLPFVFEQAIPGQSKPPRGNPDKKSQTIKRTQDAMQPTNYAYGLNKPPSVSQSYYPEFYSNSIYCNNQPPTTVRVVKQTQDTIDTDTAKHLTTTNDHQNFLSTENTIALDIQNCRTERTKFVNMAMNNSSLIPYQVALTRIDQSQQHQTMSHPHEITVIHSTTADHSYEKNTVAPLINFGTSIATNPSIKQHNVIDNNSAQQIISPSVIVVNAISDPTNQLLQMQNHISMDNGVTKGKSASKIISTKREYSTLDSSSPCMSTNSDTITLKQLITPRVMQTKKNAVESSGLDFLASTASLLAPMETNNYAGQNTKQTTSARE